MAMRRWRCGDFQSGWIFITINWWALVFSTSWFCHGWITPQNTNTFFFIFARPIFHSGQLIWHYAGLTGHSYESMQPPSVSCKNDNSVTKRKADVIIFQTCFKMSYDSNFRHSLLNGKQVRSGWNTNRHPSGKNAPFITYTSCMNYCRFLQRCEKSKSWYQGDKSRDKKINVFRWLRLYHKGP